MASVLSMTLAAVVCFMLVALASAGGRDLNVIVLENEQLTTVVQVPVTNLGDTYCCIKDGMGCVQECDSSKNYYCCLKSGFGCQQACESGKEQFCCLKDGFGSCQQLCESGSKYYCCKKNGFGSCVGMCPNPKVTLKEALV